MRWLSCWISASLSCSRKDAEIRTENLVRPFFVQFCPTARLQMRDDDITSKNREQCAPRLAVSKGEAARHAVCRRIGGGKNAGAYKVRLTTMPRDKQLSDVRLEEVLEKRRLDQALNAKEFAVLAGISYSTSREWFRAPGFPVVRGVVFWEDFVEWRRGQTGLSQKSQNQTPMPRPVEPLIKSTGLPPRAMRILAEA
jgi:hypothetical protein